MKTETMKSMEVSKALALLAVALWLSACDGGGGGGDASPNSPGVGGSTGAAACVWDTSNWDNCNWS
jgi:hypothetical protein